MLAGFLPVLQGWREGDEMKKGVRENASRYLISETESIEWRGSSLPRGKQILWEENMVVLEKRDGR